MAFGDAGFVSGLSEPRPSRMPGVAGCCAGSDCCETAGCCAAGSDGCSCAMARQLNESKIKEQDKIRRGLIMAIRRRRDFLSINLVPCGFRCKPLPFSDALCSDNTNEPF